MVKSHCKLCRHVISAVKSCRSLGLVLGEMSQFVLQRSDFAFTGGQQLSMLLVLCSIVLLRTLSVMFCFQALQLQPSPVDDLVGEDGDQDSLEHWSTAVFVEVALRLISHVRHNYCLLSGESQRTCGLLFGASVLGASGEWYVDCIRYWTKGARRMAGDSSCFVRSIVKYYGVR
jgi:hypothetical protein